MLSYLQTAQVLVALIVAVFTAAAGIVVFIHRRMRGIALDVARESSTGQAAVAVRMDALDCDMKLMAADLKEVRTEQARSEARLTGVERTVANLPSREDLHGLTILMTRFEGRMNGVDQRLQAITAFTERFQDWLLEQNR